MVRTFHYMDGTPSGLFVSFHSQKFSEGLAKAPRAFSPFHGVNKGSIPPKVMVQKRAHVSVPFLLMTLGVNVHGHVYVGIEPPEQCCADIKEAQPRGASSDSYERSELEITGTFPLRPQPNEKRYYFQYWRDPKICYSAALCDT